MKTKTSMIVGLFFAFFLLLSSRSGIQAQENDDPNWRERKLEEIKRAREEVEKLRKEIEETNRQINRMRDEIDRRKENIRSPFMEPGYWDLFPPGHPYGRRVDTDVIIMCPRSLFGRPFLGIDRDLITKDKDRA